MLAPVAEYACFVLPVSPNEDFSSPKPNFYNSATMAVQPAVIPSIHQSNLINSSCRYGEPLPLPSLYVQPGVVVDPNHCQVGFRRFSFSVFYLKIV